MRGKITTPSLDVPACMAVLRSVSTKKFWKEAQVESDPGNLAVLPAFQSQTKGQASQAIHLWQFMQPSRLVSNALT